MKDFIQDIYLGSLDDNQQVEGLDFTSILTDALQRLIDCLFNRFSVPNKAAEIKSRVSNAESDNRRHIDRWGSYKPSEIIATRRHILRSARAKGQKLTLRQATSQAISLFNEIQLRTEDEIADLISDEPDTLI